MKPIITGVFRVFLVVLLAAALSGCTTLIEEFMVIDFSAPTAEGTAVETEKTEVQQEPEAQVVSAPQPAEKDDQKDIGQRIAGIREKEEPESIPETIEPEPKVPEEKPEIPEPETKTAAAQPPGPSPADIAKQRLGVLLDGEDQEDSDILIPDADGIIYIPDITKPFFFQVREPLMFMFTSPTTGTYRIQNLTSEEVMLYAAVFSFDQDDALGENFDGEELHPEFSAEYAMDETYLMGMGILDDGDIGKTAAFQMVQLQESELIVYVEPPKEEERIEVNNPRLPREGTGAVSAAAGGAHSLILMHDGTVWAAGSNSEGQLGDGTNVSRENFVKVAEGVVQIEAARETSFLVKEDGSLWSAGLNNNRQLGDSTSGSRNTFEKVAEDVVQVSAGMWHTMIVKTDGTLWAIGNNERYMQGSGTHTTKRSWVQVTDGVEQVSTASWHHTLIIKSDASLWAVGLNGDGAHGDGTTRRKQYFEQVVEGVIFAASGGEHSMIIKEDGSLWTAGKNNAGQLGDGTLNRRLAFIQAADNASFASAYNHSMVILQDGTLWGAGENRNGQLGDGTGENQKEFVFLGDGVRHVSAGVNHSIVILEDGSVWMTGVNADGQHGDGTTENKLEFREVPIHGYEALRIQNSPPPILTPPERYHAIYHANGADRGEVPVDRNYYIGGEPVTLPDNSGNLEREGYEFVGWRVGSPEGELYASGSRYRMPNGDMDFYAAWRQVEETSTASSQQKAQLRVTYHAGSADSGTPPVDENIYAVGEQVTVLGNTGGLTKAGYDFVGWNVYDDSRDEPILPGTVFSMPLMQRILLYPHWVISEAGPEVSFSPKIMRAAAGDRYSLMITDDGKLFGAGDNYYGSFGIGTRNNEFHTPIEIANSVREVSAGAGHSVIVQTDGTAYTVGFNSSGQLGDGGYFGREIPYQVLTNVVQASAGSDHTLLLRNDATVWAFGKNDRGQLGDGTDIDRRTPVQVMTGASAVAAGSNFSLFMESDGTVWASGNNSFGQLGDGTTTNRFTPVQVFTGARSISASTFTAYILDHEGTLWASGMNREGQLGNGTTVNSREFIPVMTGVKEVFAGRYQVFILKHDNSLWAAGDNQEGQLGTGNTENQHTAVKVLEAVDCAASGFKHTVVRKLDGTFWASGLNQEGQLGTGSTENSLVFVPMRIPGYETAQKIYALDRERQRSGYFGYSVSVSGKYAIVGNYLDSHSGYHNAGSAYVFTREASGTWVHDIKLTAPDAAGDDRYGHAVAIDGAAAVVGAHNHDAIGLHSGSAYIYERDVMGNWMLAAKVTGDGGTQLDSFGWSVALNGDIVAVGAPQLMSTQYLEQYQGVEYPGSVYVFRRNAEGEWEQEAKLFSPEGDASTFGEYTAVSGNTIIVSDPTYQHGEGGAYVFQRNAKGEWGTGTKLGLPGDTFFKGVGISVGIDGDTAVVGCYEHVISPRDNGLVFVYEKDSNGNWNNTAVLSGQGGPSEGFGLSTVIRDGMIAVGAPLNTDNQGCVYIFRKDGGQWNQISQLRAFDKARQGLFGWSVTIDGDTLGIGAYENTYDGRAVGGNGAAYMYSLRSVF